jgi:phosphatidylserine/phosphatidylglycerophosphate/cardiolipin synthase-like enzyme
VHQFASAWALTKSDPKASRWIYPNAYHIKVAVRDDGTFWLSSGNWNNSNQPIIDLSDEDEAQKVAKGHDRDWHVVATNSKLADVFRAYLVNDYETAKPNQADALEIAAFAAELPTTADIQVPAAVLAPGRGFKHFFPAKTVTGRFEIQPLLTPDNYVDHVLPLINSATTRFYMQTQYIHPGTGPNDGRHNELISAVQRLVTNGVDVRLICSEFMTADWLEKLADAGLDTKVLRLQPKVHNKGIVVDSKVVMVSSQNWSADGTLRNRDAGLIIRNEEAAKYFEEIFLHDWEYLAAQRVLS